MGFVQRQQLFWNWTKIPQTVFSAKEVFSYTKLAIMPVVWSKLNYPLAYAWHICLKSCCFFQASWKQKLFYWVRCDFRPAFFLLNSQHPVIQVKMQTKGNFHSIQNNISDSTH